MATTTFALDCPICLDKLRDPVVTPCGHLGCDTCIKTHARGSSDPYEATCPTCRAPFPIVTPDMAIVPKKYHTFISPPLRRVFLGDGGGSNADVIEDLKGQIEVLRFRVGSLKRDKDLLMDRCEAAQSALARLTEDERDARLARDKAQSDTRIANQNFDRLKVEYDALKSHCARGQCSSMMAAKVKRTSGQAALDDSPRFSNKSPPSPHFNVSMVTRPIDRPIIPIPKRLRLLRPVPVASTEQTIQRSPAPFPGGSLPSVSSPSSSSSSASPPTRVQPARGSRTIGTAPMRFWDSSSSDDEGDNHDERRDAEDTPPTRITRSSSQRAVLVAAGAELYRTQLPSNSIGN